MTFKQRLESLLESYEKDHTHPVNRALHVVGVPMILLSLPLILLAPPIGIALFVLGWVLNFLGHAVEGSWPSFLRDRRFLMVGPMFVAERLRRLRSA